ncbi:MAG: P-II family nitrogen regulator [Planctomycetota bacterium]
MKLVVAVIQPIRLRAVRSALGKLGVHRFTVGDAMGYARQGGRPETFRGHEYQTQLLRKVAVEVVVNDDFVEQTIDCLIEHARSSVAGNVGDGKVFVLPVDDVIQISDGSRGTGAV